MSGGPAPAPPGNEAAARWIVRTDSGDEFTAQFVGWGTGPLHVAKLPGIPGLDSFAGHAFHTSRWDYAYTGGDPEGEDDEGAQKRILSRRTGRRTDSLRQACQPASHLNRAD